MPPKHRAARTAPRLRSTLVATTTGPVALAAVGAFIAPTAQAAPTTNSVNSGRHRRVRVLGELVDQHRQRILRWAAVHRLHVEGVRRVDRARLPGAARGTDRGGRADLGRSEHRGVAGVRRPRTRRGQAQDHRDHPRGPRLRPAPGDTAPAAKAGAGYTVVAGDTLSKIATAHRSTVAALADANHLAAPDVLAVGQHLTLGEKGGPPTMLPPPGPRGKAQAPDDTAAAPHAAVSGIVGTARTWIGTAYRWGGNTRSGVDCSGLTSQVFSANGKNLPRTADAQMNATTRITRDRARPGDLVFGVNPDGTAHHVGIYIGGGQQIDAPTAGSSVGVHQLYRDQTVFGRVQ